MPKTPTVIQRTQLLGISELSLAQANSLLKQAQGYLAQLELPNKCTNTLAGKVVVNLFAENSTRTRTSFELAAKYLGAEVVNFEVSSSSLSKGETLDDTIATLIAMKTDAIVMRHSGAGLIHQLAQRFGQSLSFINAGDGAHEHPSQALLDALTMQQSLGELKGKKVVIIGDITHSRVARSNIMLLNLLGADVHVVGPKTLIPMGIEEMGCTVHYRLETALQHADVAMCLRLQLERQSAGLIPSIDEYKMLYQLNHENLAEWAKPDCIVLHPGPVNRNLELSSALMDDPKRSKIWQQVQNGVATRMAILNYCLNQGGR